MNVNRYFVDSLNIQTWALSIMPRLIYKRLQGEWGGGTCYVINSSKIGIIVAKATGWIVRISIRKLEFRQVDVRDDNGSVLEIRIRYKDLSDIVEETVWDSGFQNCLMNLPLTNRQPTYLIKQLAASPSFGSDRRQPTLWDAAFFIQICSWKAKEYPRPVTDVLFLESRAWFSIIENYASKYNIHVVGVHPRVNVRGILRRLMPGPLINALQIVKYRGWRQTFNNLKNRALYLFSSTIRGEVGKRVDYSQSAVEVTSKSLVATPYFGQLNLDNPDMHSDLYFWQQSSLHGSDVLVIFDNPRAKLTEEKLCQLENHGIKYAVIHSGATSVESSEIRKYGSSYRDVGFKYYAGGQNNRQNRWAKDQLSHYHRLKAQWQDVFYLNNIRVFTTWSKHDASHFAIADALNELGGIMTVYQKSFEAESSPQLIISSDIVFGFSPMGARLEDQSKSDIKYHVATGYLGDHRFNLVKNRSAKLREEISLNGATHIVSFSDESTFDDPRWRFGHEVAQKDYSFWLDKLLCNPWLGLVIKPKVPGNLRIRLGQVSEMLDRAIETGRCYIFEDGGEFQGSHSPAEAALASDVAVHSHVYSATAAIESALAGVPTLMRDAELNLSNPLYKLGVNRVIFNDWDSLWESCNAEWQEAGVIAGFADWGLVLDEIDPFRDGLAGQRMGDYLKWLVDGLRSGLNKADILESAAERYTELWGADKISTVRSGQDRLDTIIKPSYIG